MVASRKTLFSWMAGAALCVLASTSAYAIPALQLGPGSGNWNYDNGTQTWTTTATSFDLNAFANDTTANGGNGYYAWDAAGAANQFGYLVLAGAPKVNVDPFDLDVRIGGTALTLVSQGFGTPPLNDPNSIPGHGIFSTWFEVYEFQFNHAATTISDQQPGGSGTGKGFVENINIDVTNLVLGTNGLHVDLFTVVGAQWNPTDPNNKALVNRFAPPSHDVEVTISEPAPLAVLGIGLLALGWMRRRKKATA